MFGTFIKELRTRRQLGLREFCLEHGHDPGNWSRLERERLLPPHDEPTLRTWARQLGLKPGSNDWLKFFEYAAVAAGRIPDHYSPGQTPCRPLRRLLPRPLRPETLSAASILPPSRRQ